MIGVNLASAQPNPLLKAIGALTPVAGLWPFAEGTGSTIRDSSPNALALTPQKGLNPVAIETFATPPAVRGSLRSYRFNGTNEWLKGSDSDAYSFGSGPFSVGAWIKNVTVNSNVIVSKNTDLLAVPQEWVFWERDTDGRLQLWLFDAPNNASIKTTADSVLDTNWHFVVGTYAGGADPSGIDLYVDGSLVPSTDASTGTYSAMQNTVTTVAVGAIHDISGGQDYFDGDIALPFVSGKRLEAEQVASLYQLTRGILGL